MKRVSRACAASGLAAGLMSAAAVLLPALVHASTGGEHHVEPGLGTLLFPTINFVLYLGILIGAYLKLIRPALQERSAQVAQELKQAAEALAGAEQELQAAKKRLSRLEAEKQELEAQFAEQGRRVVDTIIENGRKAAQNIERDAQRRIEGELKKAKAQFREEVVSLAGELARSRLRSQLSEEADARLRSETVEAMSSKR